MFFLCSTPFFTNPLIEEEKRNVLQGLTGLQFQMKEQLREREETSTQPGSQGSAYIVPHAIFTHTNVSETFPSKT